MKPQPKSKSAKTQAAGKKSSGIIVRFDPPEDAALRGYEKRGLNMSELIRRSVKKALPDVVEELVAELSYPEMQVAEEMTDATRRAVIAEMKRRGAVLLRQLQAREAKPESKPADTGERNASKERGQ